MIAASMDDRAPAAATHRIMSHATSTGASMSQSSSDLQTLLDRAAIHDVHTRYFQGIDAVYYDQVRNCFTDDIRAAYAGRAYVEGIEAVMDAFLSFKNKASGAWKATTHFMGNLSYMSLRDDVAETEVYALACLTTPGSPKDQVEIRSLRYLDRLRRTPDGWRICDRVHTLDWNFHMPATFAAAMVGRVSTTLAARGG